MSDLDEMKSQFEKKLEDRRAEHAARLEKDLHAIRAFNASLPPHFAAQAATLGATWPAASLPAHARMDLSSSNQLRALDEAFVQRFNLAAHYPTYKLLYPTVYCETLEEFYAPLVAQRPVSEAARQALLREHIAKDEQSAREGGSCILGFNLPGKGAYINGWMFAHRHGISARQAIEDPEVLRRILSTAAHEKLGHGFLAVYSALGQVKTRLGLGQHELAQHFGLRPADDPASSLHGAQANLVFHASQFLEEGWATWLEVYLDAHFTPTAHRPRYTIQHLVDAIQSLPADLAERQEIQRALLGSLGVLFGPQDQPDKILTALGYMAWFGESLDAHFGPCLGQPMPYVLGELLFNQAEINVGAACLPYAALIAANITFDPAKISLGDLEVLLANDPRLNPDARLVALSRLRLSQKDSLPELVQRASAQLSLTVPDELKKLAS